MEFKVEMLAFGKPDEIRIVDVPNEEITGIVRDDLDLIYHYGQNDFQPKQHPSVSVGDVIQFAGERYAVASVGFVEFTEAEYNEYLKANRIDRQFHDLLYYKKTI